MEKIAAIKIPAFIPADTALWFMMIETTINLASPKAITESKMKYNYCDANLPPEIAMTVRDIISPDKTDPFGQAENQLGQFPCYGSTFLTKQCPFMFEQSLCPYHLLVQAKPLK